MNVVFVGGGSFWTMAIVRGGLQNPTMTRRERFLRTLNNEPVDRPPLYLAGPWQETLARWDPGYLAAGGQL